MFDAHAQKNILIVMLQIFDNLFHYKNIVTVQWIKRLKLCMVTKATLPPAKELKIHRGNNLRHSVGVVNT